MDAEVFAQKISDLVNEFTENIGEDTGEIIGNNCRIIYKKIEKTYTGTLPGSRWEGALSKPGYRHTYCCSCGRPIYYKGNIVPTRCSQCDN